MSAWPDSLEASPEFRLAAACAAWPPGDHRDGAIRRVVGAGVDWSRFLQVVERHRVGGLAQNGITSAGVDVPAPFRTELVDNARIINQQELYMAFEAVRLQTLLLEQRHSPLILKGVAVALSAFGRLGLRENRDIDILVPPDQLISAATGMSEAGYVRVEPNAAYGPDTLLAWTQRHKDIVFQHAERGTIVEIHGRLFDNRHLFAGIDPFRSPYLRQLTPDTQLRVLPPSLEFVYLCVHGAQHAWSRLKWLADFGALLAQLDDSEIRARFVLAQSLGVERAVAQAMAVSQKVLGTTAPAFMAELCPQDIKSRWLESVALSSMVGDGGGAELEDRPFATTKKNLSHYLLAGGWKYWTEELKYDLDDDASRPQSAALLPLRVLGRPVYWAWRRFPTLIGRTPAPPPGGTMPEGNYED